METSSFFVYNWFVDTNQKEVTYIRAYGIGDNNENICLHITDFYPYVYIELPPLSNTVWTTGLAQLVVNKINSELGNQKPLETQFVFKKRLYGAELVSNSDTFTYKKFPYIFCAFSSRSDIKSLTYKIKKPVCIASLGYLQLKMHESDAPDVLQLICNRNIPSVGWIKFMGYKVRKEEHVTLCDYEYTVSYKNLARSKKQGVANPLIMGFDIEVNSGNPLAMPDSKKPTDKVFQISCVLSRTGDGDTSMDNHLLSLGCPDTVYTGDDIIIHRFNTEGDLLDGFATFVNTWNPNVLVGYNILGFDIQYMIDRAKFNHCIKFFTLGMHKYNMSIEKTIKWSSSAYKNQEFSFLDAEGRIFVDLLPLVQRDFKFNNYKLKTISEYFLQDTKDDLSPKGIFKCYRVGIKNTNGVYSENSKKAMSICGKYCVKDSVLVCLLLEKLQTWVGLTEMANTCSENICELHVLTEMANTCNSQIFSLYTQGQQIKVYSQLYRYCTEKGIVVEKDGYVTHEDDRYMGAYVFTPEPGKYKNVVPFDFCLSENTCITCRNGLSRKITQFFDGAELMSYSVEKGVCLSDRMINSLLNKGTMNTVCVEFATGDTIICTPDHKFMCTDGEWRKAIDLRFVSVKKCMYGIFDDPSVDKDSGFSIHVTRRGLSHIWSMCLDRERILAYARLLGFLYTDMGASIVHDTMYDLKSFEADLEFTSVDICDIIHEKCPLSVIREFLAGLFGRKGMMPSLFTDTEFSPIRLVGVDSSLVVALLGRFGIKCEDIYSPDIVICKDSTLKFANNIGFRYAINKSYKLDLIRLCLESTSVPIVFLKSLGLESWFTSRLGIVPINETTLPVYDVLVTNVTTVGNVNVYDIEVETNHNFIANGVIAHNCSMYPSTIIAYNIDYHTWVKDDSDIPDELCNVMEWEEHQYCQHDEKIKRLGVLNEYIDKEKAVISELRQFANKAKPAEKARIRVGISKKVEELKPYVTERSDINKAKPKVITCAKYRYRFLKEPLGVLPSILQNLLEARKTVRSVHMKKIKGKIAELKEGASESASDNERELVKLYTELNILDKRQLSYKVSCNSGYGIMGTKKGYIPFMPGAACTTFLARTNIIQVADIVTTKYNGQLIYGDSDCILCTTPILIFDTNTNQIMYTTVDEISSGVWTHYNNNKEISNCKDGYQIWSDNGFTPIKCVVRCCTTKPISRVLTHVGMVQCSSEHSLLTDDLQQVSASEVSVGDNLCISQLPLPPDTPTTPLYNNNLTLELIEQYVIPDSNEAELAFIYGLFFADGGASICQRSSGSIVYTWAINKKDHDLLTRCANLLEGKYENLTFKIISTCTGVYKLIPSMISRKGKSKVEFVTMYRSMFYDNKKYKKIPDIILNSNLDIRTAFFMGYYAGDGSKKDPAMTCTNKGQIGTAGLFYLFSSIGYKVSINTRSDKPNCFKLTCSTPDSKFRYDPKKVKKIDNFNIPENEYIYDIQTENHHFAAGIGQIVVHNSSYVYFPEFENKPICDLWDYATSIADEISSVFKNPIKLEFEQVIYSFFFILTKKRYMYRSIDNRDGASTDKIGNKGVVLARRDNSKYIRDVYEGVISRISNNTPRDEVLNYCVDKVNELFTGGIPKSDYIVTKALGDIGNFDEAIIDGVTPVKNDKGELKCQFGNYITPYLPLNTAERSEKLAKKCVTNERDFYISCLPAPVQLAIRMRARGQRVDPGTRLEYVITNPSRHTAKQYEKIESYDYFIKNGRHVKIDYYYYLKALVNPLDQVLNVAFKDVNDFMLAQYKYRYSIREKCLNELKSLFKPRIVLIKE